MLWFVDKSYYVKGTSFFFGFFLLLLSPQLLCLGLAFYFFFTSRDFYTPKVWECLQSTQHAYVTHLANNVKG